MTYQEFLDLDFRKLYIVKRGITSLREQHLNDDQFIGMRNAIKNGQAVWGDKHVTDLKDIKLPREDTENSVVEQRNDKLLETLRHLGIAE